jgi:hypothetical protein
MRTRLKIRGDKLTAVVVKDDREIARIIKSVDDLKINIRGILRDEFREGYYYTEEWFVKVVMARIESELRKTIYLMSVEAIANANRYPIKYYAIHGVWELIGSIAKEEIPLDDGVAIFRLEKCFVLLCYSKIYAFPYDPSMVNIDEVDEEMYRDIRRVCGMWRYKLPKDIGSVIDYYMVMCESMRR